MLNSQLAFFVRTFLVFLVCVLAPITSSQAALFNQTNTNINFNNITPESLPHPTVLDVEQDHHGYIWIATRNGAARYDGKSFQIYQYLASDPSSISNNWISDVHVDREGRVWLASAGDIHLYLPEVDGFKNFNVTETLQLQGDISYVAIAEAENGDLYFATTESGMLKLNVDDASFSHITYHPNIKGLLSDNQLSDLTFDNNGNLIIGTTFSGINILTKNQEVIQLNVNSSPTIPANDINTLYVDNKNRVWAGTQSNGVFVITNNQITAHHNEQTGFCSNTVKDIIQTPAGHFWFATEKGLCELLPNTSVFIAHQNQATSKNSLIENITSSLFVDKGGVLWAGTQAGISTLNVSIPSFEQYNDHSDSIGLTSNMVTSFARYNDKLYIGTWEGGLNIIDIKSGDRGVLTTTSTNNLALAENKVMSLLKDSKNNLWIGTYQKGINIIPASSDTIEVVSSKAPSTPQLSDNAIVKMIELSTGEIAIATYGGGVNIVDYSKKSISVFNKRSTIPLLSDSIMDITEDVHGNLWIATLDSGIQVLNATRSKLHTFNVQAKDKGLLSNNIVSLLIDGDYIYAGTADAGIAQIKIDDLDIEFPTVTHITSEHGLASNFVYGMLADEYGFIWLAQSKGLSRVNPNDFSVKNFTTSHGLQSNDFNSGAHFKDAEGRMYFGGTNGFNSFMPNKVPINQYRPPLRITKFSQSNIVKPLHSLFRTDGVLELPYNKTIIDIEFAALDYTKPENNQYRYKMEGLTDTWVELGNNNHVSFSYLQDGFYTLKIQGSNSDGIWSDQEIELQIEVLPPLWRTWYAYLLYVVLISTAIALFIRQQNERLERQLAHERKLHRLAYYDSLTGLPNRQNFYDNLEKFLNLAKRGNYKAGVMFIDLDRFKRINDTLGHDFGDKVLQVVSTRLQESVRSCDFVSSNGAKLNDVNNELARLGGDEFTLFLSQLSSPEETAAITHRIIENVSQPITIDNYEVSVSPSIGIAIYPDNGETVGELMKHADIAMYQAKEDGRRTFKYYSDSLNDRALERLQLEEYMRGAVEAQQFELYYQPQVDLNSNKVTKAEALIRWHHPTLGFVSPAEFIPMAEESGLIIEIGDWILDTACQQAKQWQQQGLDNVRVSVNVSSVQFKQTALIEKIQRALDKAQLPAQLLEIELTESAIMSDLEENIIRLQKLKDMGVTIACDDFGTGYSSLSYLKKFPIDTLKIDRSFIIDVATNENDAAIVKAIMLLAQTMQLNVVAEGVEDIEQLKVLKEYQCELIQGYFFSKPLTNDDFVNFVKEEFYQDKFMWELELLGS